MDTVGAAPAESTRKRSPFRCTATKTLGTNDLIAWKLWYVRHLFGSSHRSRRERRKAFFNGRSGNQRLGNRKSLYNFRVQRLQIARRNNPDQKNLQCSERFSTPLPLKMHTLFCKSAYPCVKERLSYTQANNPGYAVVSVLRSFHIEERLF